MPKFKNLQAQNDSEYICVKAMLAYPKNRQVGLGLRYTDSNRL